jgi:hypothetical protein
MTRKKQIAIRILIILLFIVHVSFTLRSLPSLYMSYTIYPYLNICVDVAHFIIIMQRLTEHYFIHSHCTYYQSITRTHTSHNHTFRSFIIYNHITSITFILSCHSSSTNLSILYVLTCAPYDDDYAME